MIYYNLSGRATLAVTKMKQIYIQIKMIFEMRRCGGGGFYSAAPVTYAMSPFLSTYRLLLNFGPTEGLTGPQNQFG